MISERTREVHISTKRRKHDDFLYPYMKWVLLNQNDEAFYEPENPIYCIDPNVPSEFSNTVLMKHDFIDNLQKESFMGMFDVTFTNDDDAFSVSKSGRNARLMRWCGIE